MGAALVAGILLFAAPDAGAKALRIAYASLYEWREDKVSNATFDFKFEFAQKGRRPEEIRKWSAEGSVVFLDGEIARVHVDGPNRARRGEMRGEIVWVLSRFARKPFDERFKDAKFKGPVDRAGGLKAVSLGGTAWLIADDRIVALEQAVGTPEKPSRIRIDLKPAEVGDGYALLDESASYGSGKQAVSWSKSLTVAEADGAIPVPDTYTHTSKIGMTARTTKITFSSPRLNTNHPIVLQPAIRDQVKAAWERRYRIPADVRIDGEWNREQGKSTVKGGWTRKAFGEFQYLRGEFEVMVSEKLKLNQGTRDAMRTRATGHIRTALDLVLDTPFSKAFENCGFERNDENPGIVKLLGHPTMLALRIEDGLITGHLEDAFGGEGWWDYRYKKASDGRVLIDRMTRRVEKKKWHTKIVYKRVGEYQIPKSIEVLVPARPWRGSDPTEVGILKYSFRKLEAQPPKE